MTTEQLYKQNTLETRKKLIEPEAIFTDGFNCSMGEDKCPIKKQNSILEHQHDLAKIEIKDKQQRIEELEQKFNDEVLKGENGPEELKRIAAEVQEAEVIKKRDMTIRGREREIKELLSQVEDRDNKIRELEDERDTLMTTGYEADLKFGDKIKQYQDLIKRHDLMLSKVTKLEARSVKLENTIKENETYQRELAGDINRQVLVAREHEKHVAKLRVEKGKLTKVKPVSNRGKNPLAKLFGKKDGS